MWVSGLYVAAGLILWGCSLDWWKIKRNKKSFIIKVLSLFHKRLLALTGKITNIKVNP